MMFLTLSSLGLILGRIAAVLATASVGGDAPTGLRRCDACGNPRSILNQLFLWFPGTRCFSCSSRDRLWPFWVSLSSAALYTLLGWFLVTQGCQTVTEVRPTLELWQNRLPFQMLFLFLIITATITDFLDYVVPDMIVLPGALIAVLWATLSGELQMIHVWVNWDDDFASLYGPYLPEWMKLHQHLHGLVWSCCGMLTGAGVMWAGRAIAQGILGVPAIGFGDVTLMAMIGAFMGWQPTLCVLAIAPIVGVILGLGWRLLTGRSFVAFGPYLCLAAYVVLCCWAWLWEVARLKIIFSHWPTVTGLVAGAFVVYCVLLTGLRIYKATPAKWLRI